MHLVHELSPIQIKIKENTQFTNIAVRRTWYTFRNNRDTVKKTTSIDVLPFLNKAKFDNVVLQFAEIEKAVDIVIDSYPDIEKCDYINIQVRTGFNIGIFSYYFRQTQRFTTDGKWLTKK